MQQLLWDCWLTFPTQECPYSVCRSHFKVKSNQTVFYLKMNIRIQLQVYSFGTFTVERSGTPSVNTTYMFNVDKLLK